MRSFFRGRSSSSEKSHDERRRGKGKEADVGHSSEDDTPAPPGFEERTPVHETHSGSETEDPEMYEQPPPENQDEDIEGHETDVHDVDRSQGRPPRPLKSEIFTKHFRRITGPDGKIRGYCNYCSSSYSWKSGDGYGTFTRHMRGKHPSEFGLQASQQQIGRSGSSKQAKIFQYRDETYKHGLSRMISGMHLSYGAGQHPDLRYCHEETLNPQARSYSARTMKRYTDEQYHKGKRELACRFESLDTCVSICSDIWTDRWNENSYMGITCHWIDERWLMHKRLLALRYMDGRHTAHNIYSTISTILREYRLTKKIFSIGFDNAAANTKTIPELKRLCQPTLGGSFFHIRCACHILNLCVKDGLDTLQIKYHPIKEVVGYLADHPTINKAWRRFCIANGVKPRKFKKDVQHRWNSTYELLQSTVPYKEPLCDFASTNLPDMPLHPSDWDICGNLLQVLKIFYDCTKTFSRVYTPSVHLFIMEACNIVGTLNQVRGDVLLQGAINDMCAKWLNYYREIPMIYNIGMILDPRFRVEGLRHYINLYYEIIDGLSDTEDRFTVNPVQVVREAEKVFNDLYNQFSFSYGGQIPLSPSLPSTGQSSRSDEGPPGLAAYRQWFRKPSGSGASGAAEEITNYLNTAFEFGDNIDARDFQVIEWWRSHSRTFPILSRMARQVLAAPASNVAVEQAFSTAGLILDDRKSRMSAVTVESLACNDDWNRAQQRIQEMHYTTSEEDEYFSDFNTSGGSTGGSTPDPCQDDP